MPIHRMKRVTHAKRHAKWKVVACLVLSGQGCSAGDDQAELEDDTEATWHDPGLVNEKAGPPIVPFCDSSDIIQFPEGNGVERLSCSGGLAVGLAIATTEARGLVKTVQARLLSAPAGSDSSVAVYGIDEALDVVCEARSFITERAIAVALCPQNTAFYLARLETSEL